MASLFQSRPAPGVSGVMMRPASNLTGSRSGGGRFPPTGWFPPNGRPRHSAQRGVACQR